MHREERGHLARQWKSGRSNTSRCIPLGFIVKELVTNSTKYAIDIAHRHIARVQKNRPERAVSLRRWRF